MELIGSMGGVSYVFDWLGFVCRVDVLTYNPIYIACRGAHNTAQFKLKEVGTEAVDGDVCFYNEGVDMETIGMLFEQFYDTGFFIIERGE